MKIKVTESQLTTYFKEVLEELQEQSPGNLINEELSSADKNEIKSMVKKEIKNFLNLSRSEDFEKKVTDIIKKKFKNDKDIEKHIVDIVKNVLIQLYKNLWTKRNFWSNDLKNLPS